MKYSEFEEWDQDNSSARVIVGFRKSAIENIDCEDIVSHYGLEIYENGELQKYMYSGNMPGIRLHENKYSHEIFVNEYTSSEELIAQLEQFSFDHFWFFDEGEFGFISDWEWSSKEDAIDIAFDASDYFAIFEVCVVND